MDILKRVLAVSASVFVTFILAVVVVFGFLYNESWGNSSALTLISVLSIFAIPIAAGVYVNRRITIKRLRNNPQLASEMEAKKAEINESKKRREEERELRYMIQASKIEQRVREKKEAENRRNAVLIEKSKERSIFDRSGKLQLIGGLGNIPAGSICKVRYNQDHIVFTVSGQEFNLEASKMIDVSVMTPTEIQKQYVSSVGGAVAGAILLGPLGAIIGGSASKKTVLKTNRYLVISYRSEEEIKYIVFDVSTESILGNSIQRTYKDLKKNAKVKVEL